MPPARDDAGVPPIRGPRGPVDPDVDLHDPDQQREWARHRVVLPVIAAGGMVGAAARHLAEVSWPPADGGVPWATLAINVTGCLLIGVLMVLVVEVGGAHPLRAVGYLVGTVVLALAAVTLGVVAARGVVRRRTPSLSGPQAGDA